MWSFALGLNGLALLLTRAAGLSMVDLDLCLLLPSLCLIAALVVHRRWPHRHGVAYMFEVFALISCLKIPLVLLSYVGVAVALPLWDGTFLRLDQSMGLDWPAIMHWLDRQALLAGILHGAYRTLWYQLVALVVIATISGRRDDIRCLLASVIVALGVTITIGTLFPALGVLSEYPNESFEVLQFTGGSTPIPFAQALRTGSLTGIDLWQPQGLVVFPSFHAAMAVILAAGSLRHRPAAMVLLPLNALMFVSAYTEGGHYMCDLVAGAAIGMVARIAAVHGIERRRSHARRAVANRSAQDGHTATIW